MTETAEEKYQKLATEFAGRCVAIDLEVGKADTKIHQIGAVRIELKDSTSAEFSYSKGPLGQALAELDRFSSRTEFALGAFKRPSPTSMVNCETR